MGSWDLDLQENKLSWSDEAYRIFGADSKDFVPSYEIFLDHVHPDDSMSGLCSWCFVVNGFLLFAFYAEA